MKKSKGLDAGASVQSATEEPEDKPKKKKINKKTVIAVILLLAGCAVFFYPSLGNVISYFQQISVVSDYEKQVAEMNNKEIRRQKELAIKYNENLGQITFKDPFTNKDEQTEPQKTEDEKLDDYFTALSINDEHMMGYIKIPEIRLSCPIYHGATEFQLQKGIGHLEGTALPVGGIGTHCVLTGHTGVPGNMLFTDLDKLEVGDKFYLHILDEVLAYKIDQINVVEPGDTSKIRTEADKDLCTLITCTPYGINTHRLLVRGIRSDYIEGEDNYESGSILTTDSQGNVIEKRLDGGSELVNVFGIMLPIWMLWLIIPVAALILIIITVVIIRCILRKRRKTEGLTYKDGGKETEQQSGSEPRDDK